MSTKRKKIDLKPTESDWCRVRETLLMLNLAMAQISNAMREGDESVNSLADSFTSMMDCIQNIDGAATALPESAEQSTITTSCQAVSSQMQEAIIAFQFYDKLSQRLNHLTQSLGRFSELLSSPEQIDDADAWYLLQEEIKANYPIETDKAMFDAVLEGKSVAEVLHLMNNPQPRSGNDDIELF